MSADFHPDEPTHATQNRFDRGYRFMRTYMGPIVDGRALKTLWAIHASPTTPVQESVRA